jgi:hypothetical protein
VSDTAEVCLLNIGPKQRALRLRFGAIALVIGLALATALVVAQVPVVWRLTLFLPFLMATTGFVQARRRT